MNIAKPPFQAGDPHDVTLAEGVVMHFRYIPAGGFRAGSRGNYADEEPTTQVLIPNDFWLGETPVTQAEFAQCPVEELGETHENDFKGENCEQHPAESMTWWQAVRYCDWLTRSYGTRFPKGYRLACLPTEVEWEYACRAGTDTDYYSGDGAAALAEIGRHEKYGQSTRPVRQAKPNQCHLHDLNGHVWQWCHDGLKERPFRRLVPGSAPMAITQRTTEMEGDLAKLLTDDRRRVMRGGSWFDLADDCRSAFRFRSRPGVRDWSLGFRVCLVRGPAEPKTEGRGAEEAQGPGDAGRGTSPESDGPSDAGRPSPGLRRDKVDLSREHISDAHQ